MVSQWQMAEGKSDVHNRTRILFVPTAKKATWFYEVNASRCSLPTDTGCIEVASKQFG